MAELFLIPVYIGKINCFSVFYVLVSTSFCVDCPAGGSIIMHLKYRLFYIQFTIWSLNACIGERFMGGRGLLRFQGHHQGLLQSIWGPAACLFFVTESRFKHKRKHSGLCFDAFTKRLFFFFPLIVHFTDSQTVLGKKDL